MSRSNKRIFILLFLVAFISVNIYGQNYRDQRKLIRLKPNSLLVFGQIETPAEESLTGATISLFNPSSAKIIETIPVDDLGEYLFTLEKGRTFGLIIEKDGLFPYYTQFIVPVDIEKEWEKSIKLPDGLINTYALNYEYGATNPSNTEELENLTSSLVRFNDLSVWVQEDSVAIFQNRIDNLKSIFSEAGIDSYRLLIGAPPTDPDRYIRLRIIGSAAPANNEIIESETEASEEEAVEDEEKPAVSPDKWTLQFIASKNELTGKDLKSVEDYKLFKGKDGYYRYTYGIYDSKEDSQAGKSYLRNKGFNQAFAKKIADLQKL